MCVCVPAGQVFLGAVSSVFGVRPVMVRLVSGLDSACIRLVYFSTEQEIKSKVITHTLSHTLTHSHTLSHTLTPTPPPPSASMKAVAEIRSFWTEILSLLPHAGQPGTLLLCIVEFAVVNLCYCLLHEAI